MKDKILKEEYSIGKDSLNANWFKFSTKVKLLKI